MGRARPAPSHEHPARQRVARSDERPTCQLRNILSVDETGVADERRHCPPTTALELKYVKGLPTYAATPIVLALSALSVRTCLVAQEQHIRQPAGIAPVAAQGDHPMSKSPNIVLVHGAWADGFSWSSVIQRLQKAGYHVAAVQLGLTSLDEDVARTRALLAAQTGPTLLVAHSFGGAVITQLGTDAPNVIGLVYESAFAPDQGETLKGLLSQPPQPPGRGRDSSGPRGVPLAGSRGVPQVFRA